MKLQILTIFLPVAFCQIKPDVSFDENNDRFDLTPLMQEGSFDQWGDFMDGVRRFNRLSRRDNDDTKVSEATSKFMEALRGFQQNFDFKRPNGLDSEDSEEKVQMRRDLVSYLHDNQPDDMTRRSGKESDVDREVLMHHAVPIVMKVEGIIQMPKS